MGKLKKVKQKTHKASAKRFKLSASGKVMHKAQGGGNGHSRGYQSRSQRASKKEMNALRSGKEARKIRTLMGE